MRKDPSAWTLEAGAPRRGDAEVVIDEDTAWRVFTKGLDRERAARKVELIGDRRLGAKLLETVAIIA